MRYRQPVYPGDVVEIEARVKQHGPDSIHNFSGLEHGLPLTPDELPIANDFVAPALYFEKFRKAAPSRCSSWACRLGPRP